MFSPRRGRVGVNLKKKKRKPYRNERGRIIRYKAGKGRYRDAKGRFIHRWFDKHVRKRAKKRRPTKSKEGWIPILDYINEIREKYSIPVGAVNYPPTYIKWVEKTKLFWCWIQKFPPYEMGEYVKVEIWFVIRDERTDEYFLISRSRVKGMENGIEFDEAVKIKDDLLHDVEEWLSRKDYMEFIGLVGWTIYPYADWYNKTVKSRRGEF